MHLNIIGLLTGVICITAVALASKSAPSAIVKKWWVKDQTFWAGIAGSQITSDQSGLCLESESALPVEQIASVGIFIPPKRCNPAPLGRYICPRARGPPHVSPVLAGLLFLAYFFFLFNF
jgi:hypothetical protein